MAEPDGDELAALTLWQRVVFVAACVEFLFPAYARFCQWEGVGVVALMRSTLDAVWAQAGQRRLDGSALVSPAVIEALLPQQDDWNDWAPQAEDAVAALVFLVRLVRDGDPRNAVHAAGRAHSAVDEFVLRRVDEDADAVPSLDGSDVETERRRQETAVLGLRAAGDDDPHVLADLRSQARRHAAALW